MSTNSGDTITEKVRMLSEAGQQQVIELIDGLLKEEQAVANARPIWEIFAELSAQVPAEEWRKLPSDGAEQHDHYLYGAPKKENASEAATG